MAISDRRPRRTTSTPADPRRRLAAGVLTPAAIGLLIVWALFPIALLLAHAASDRARLTGANGLIGADGVLGADQLQYLAWARDAAAHGGASDLFRLTPSAHVYLEPIFGVIGGLSDLGVSLLVGEVGLTLLGAVVLALAAVRWARRLVPESRRAAGAAVALGLFCSSPIPALITWTQVGPRSGRFDAYLAGGELPSATKLWGYLPAVFGIASLPLALIWLERALDDVTTPPRRRRARLLAAAAGLVGSWLHPWQGAILALILIGLLGWRRRRRELAALGGVLAATILPLAYYLILSRADSAWRMASGLEDIARLPAWVLLSALGPLAAIALAGARRPGDELAEQALVLWIPAALVAYFAIDAFPTHSLEGLGIPFGVLAVRAGERAGRPLRRWPWVRDLIGVAALLALTIPIPGYDARKFVRVSNSRLVQYELPHDDVLALRWVSAHAPPGGVLAPTPFAAVIPSQTDRRVWVGHGDWSPRYRARARVVDRLFDDRMRAPAARRFVAGVHARILVADCAHPRAAAALRALAVQLVDERTFGCARVAILRRVG